MNEKILRQAREIHQTVRMLRDEMINRYTGHVTANGGGVVCSELTFPQRNALLAIHENGVMTIKELAKALHVSPPSASAMAERLVEMGMLRREQSKRDRREVVIQLSEPGEESIEALEEDILQYLAYFIERIGPDMAEQWCDIYERIRAIIAEERDEEVENSKGEQKAS